MVEEAHSGILLMGITPPRQNVTPERVAEIAAVTLARLAKVDLDGLILYDIDDESDRNPADRPFPYLPTMDPAIFHRDHLAGFAPPAVIYRCVGKYSPESLRSWLETVDCSRVMSVFVGASSSDKPVRTDLRVAQDLRSTVRPELAVGGVCITERYSRGRDEHLRMVSKQERGCRYFVTQVVYDVDATKSMLSDYYYTCRERGIAPRPVILTMSVCGSLKTLAFLKWLGVDVPRWLENALQHAPDPLAESYDQCVRNARELAGFCRRLGLPFGFNVESVSIRKVEIDASVALAIELRELLG
jgi:hypothetical protein